MKKIVNSCLFYSKIVLLLIAFTLTLYISFSINAIEKDLLSIFLVGLPLFLILVLFMLSIFKDSVKENTLFNLASTFALLAIIIIDYRTIFDKNMVLWHDFSLNIYYFMNALFQIKLLGYLMVIGNILLFVKKEDKS